MPSSSACWLVEFCQSSCTAHVVPMSEMMSSRSPMVCSASSVRPAAVRRLPPRIACTAVG
eukprot:242276-Prymnesium_polylepis.1